MFYHRLVCRRKVFYRQICYRAKTQLFNNPGPKCLNMLESCVIHRVKLFYHRSVSDQESLRQRPNVLSFNMSVSGPVIDHRWIAKPMCSKKKSHWGNVFYDKWVHMPIWKCFFYRQVPEPKFSIINISYGQYLPHVS